MSLDANVIIKNSLIVMFFITLKIHIEFILVERYHMKLDHVLNEYLDYCQLYRKNGTYESYKQSFVLLNKIFDGLGLTETSELNDRTYNDMIRWLKNNTIKKNSKINDLMATLKAALNHSQIEYKFKFVKLTDATTHFKPLNKDEIKQLIQYLSKLDLNDSNNLVWVTVVYLLLDTGARKNELLNILNSEIDFTKKTIRLEATKNAKRTVKFGSLSEELLIKLHDPNRKYLLYNRLRDETLSAKSLEVFFVKLNRKLKFSSGSIHPHRLRKTFATELMKMGCPIPTIQRLLGHSDIKMTMIYLDVDTFTLNTHYKQYYPF